MRLYIALILLLCLDSHAESLSFGAFSANIPHGWSYIQPEPGCGLGPHSSFFRNSTGNIWVILGTGEEYHSPESFAKDNKLIVLKNTNLLGEKCVIVRLKKEKNARWLFLPAARASFWILVFSEGNRDIKKAITWGISPPEPQCEDLLKKAEKFIVSSFSYDSHKVFHKAEQGAAANP